MSMHAVQPLRAVQPPQAAGAARTAQPPAREVGNQARLRALGAQAKLQVGSVDDPLEREADAVADTVMRMPDPALALTPGPARVSRKCAACEDKPGRVSPKHESASAFSGGGPAPASVQGALAGSGRPLDAAARGFFEPRFGRDLSPVRVHTGAEAARSAADVQARAYAVGRDLVFGHGQYQPGSADGRRLIAHELAHVFQQGAGGEVRRKVISPSAADATEVAGYMNIFSAGTVKTKGSQLEMAPGACPNKADPGCDCACEAVLDPARVFSVRPLTCASFTANKILFDGSSAAVPSASFWPGTTRGGGAFTGIDIPKKGSSAEFGVFDSAGKGVWQPTWRILAHELCGHGVKKQTYDGDYGDRELHNATIDTENDIATKHGEPARGHYADKRQGESFNNDVKDRTKVRFQLKGPCPKSPSPTECVHYESPAAPP